MTIEKKLDSIELPLFCQPTLDALKYTSAVGNAAVAIVVGLTVAFALGLLHAPPTLGEHVSVLPPPAGASDAATQIGVFGVFVFAYACSMNVPTIAEEARRDPA